MPTHLYYMLKLTKGSNARLPVPTVNLANDILSIDRLKAKQGRYIS